MQPPSERYTTTAIFFHWMIALLIIGTFAVGLYMTNLHFSPFKLQLISWHKWAGITVLWLAFLRLLWRITHRPPEHTAPIPKWQRSIATGLHHLFYLLMCIIPLSGWAMSSAKGFDVVYFGLWRLPALVAKNKELGEQLEEVHEILTYTLMALVIGHALVALKHHFIERNNVLVRMLPLLKQRSKH